MAENTEKLLPCPFCGNPNPTLHASDHWIGLYSVYCDVCGATIGEEGTVTYNHGTTKEEAIAAWNKRSNDNAEQMCVWTMDEYSIWETSCGNTHEFFVDGPRENPYTYCPYCGLPIETRPTGEEEQND